MKKGIFSKLVSTLKCEDIHSIESEKLFYNSIIDGVINAKNSGDLKVQLDKIKNYKWRQQQRATFLIGLLQGALMQYKKEVSIEELETIFKTI